MVLGMEVGLDPGLIVLDGGPSSARPKKGTQPPALIFGPCLLWPKGWMDQDATSLKLCLCPGHIVLHGDPASPERGADPLP